MLNINPFIGEYIVGATLGVLGVISVVLPSMPDYLINNLNFICFNSVLLSIIPLSKSRKLKVKKKLQKSDLYYVTGFCDAESYFTISIRRSNKMKTGWLVELIFGINISRKDLAILETIKVYLNGIGKVTVRENVAHFRVSSIKDLEII